MSTDGLLNWYTYGCMITTFVTFSDIFFIRYKTVGPKAFRIIFLLPLIAIISLLWPIAAITLAILLAMLVASFFEAVYLYVFNEKERLLCIPKNTWYIFIDLFNKPEYRLPKKI